MLLNKSVPFINPWLWALLFITKILDDVRKITGLITSTTYGPNINSCRLRTKWPASGKVSCGMVTDTTSNAERPMMAGCVRNMRRSTVWPCRWQTRSVKNYARPTGGTAAALWRRWEDPAIRPPRTTRRWPSANRLCGVIRFQIPIFARLK